MKFLSFGPAVALAMSLAVLSPHAASAQPTASAAPRTQAATLEIDGGDTTTEHLCPTGDLTSVRAHNGNANIPVIFVDRHHNTAPTGRWLRDPAGFRLKTGSLFSVTVEMICTVN